MDQFFETKIRFENATMCEYPLTYDTWVSLPDGLRAAALFVNFYDVITLAWYKARADYISEEEGIGVLMQYLLKNVSLIADNPKKFTSGYIYTVAFNCMGALRRVKREYERHQCCISQYAYDGNDEIDLFTRIADDYDVMDDEEIRTNSSSLWGKVDAMNVDVQKVVDHLVNGAFIGKRVMSRMDSIMDQLRKELAEYRHVYLGGDNTMYFKDVLDMGDKVASAVVVMRDGVQAVYYGETRVSKSGNIDAVFYGPNYDYFVPVDQSGTLVVKDVEMVGKDR